MQRKVGVIEKIVQNFASYANSKAAGGRNNGTE